jgi:hypothetical protein
MKIPIPTARDIQVFRQDGGFMTIAADTLGAIGEKPGDLICVAPEICGRMTVRVCLMETLAAGARPFALTALTCNEYDPTGVRLLAGIRKELTEAGFPDLPISGSAEDNMRTDMTALGITLLGECDRLLWRLSGEGDGVYLLGLPYVGEEVLEHFDDLPGVLQLRRLREMPFVGDMLPCGSRGIAWELQTLERETGLSVKTDPGLDCALLQKSAGPATCVIFTARENTENTENRVIKIGTLLSILPST